MNSNPFIDKAILFIAKNFNSECSLEIIANEVGLSKFYFHRIFKIETHETLNEYVHRLRMEHAVHLFKMYSYLANTDVAFQCGYQSPNEFARVFKRHFNCSPTEFKKSISTPKSTRKAEFHFEIPIIHCKKLRLKVDSTTFEKEKVESAFQRLINVNNEPLFGIYIDVPLHINPSKCRYFAGKESDKDCNFETEEGYYTFIQFRGNQADLFETIIDFKMNKIDRSPYEIASFVAFEKITLKNENPTFDYAKVDRKIYIPIRKKTARFA